MSKPILGIDFGSGNVKLVLSDGNQIVKTVSVETPDKLVINGVITSKEAMADFLKEKMKENDIKAKRCAISISSALSYVRTINVPKMTVDELSVNLPYEFKDYIVQGKEKYNYDYSVISDDDNSMTLMACAALKSDIIDLREMCRVAGLKLVQVVPDEFSLKYLIEEKSNGEPVCVVDFGHQTTTVHMFKDNSYDTTRTIDMGGFSIDQEIADHLNIDEHIARVNKETNHENVMDLEVVKNIYTSICTEVMRAINFYNYGNAKGISKCYVCGGGANNKALIEELENTIGIKVEYLGKIYDSLDTNTHQYAYGATLM
ncbi:MAG: pilus assembly protein PilM [Erysipelotrichaceae bacterium]|nr:pilus assembly protein PilM [Erysipelotrichaceae bacterium]